jgi:hypothetical protein
MLQLPLPTSRERPSPNSERSPSSSTDPHGGIFVHYVMGWHSCNRLLLTVITAQTCFPNTSFSGNPTARLQPSPSCFQPRMPLALPLLLLQRPQLWTLTTSRAAGVTLSRTGFRLKRPEPKANMPYLPYVKAADVWRLGSIFILALLNSRFPYVKPAVAWRFILYYVELVFIFILALLISYFFFHILLFST